MNSLTKKRLDIVYSLLSPVRFDHKASGETAATTGFNNQSSTLFNTTKYSHNNIDKSGQRTKTDL